MIHSHLGACPSIASGQPNDCSCEKEGNHYLTLAKISFTLFTFEFIGGLLSGSMALMSDALHVLLDGTENIISAIVSRLATKGHDENRVRTVGGRISASLLLFAGFVIVYEGYERIITPQKIEGFMVIVAFIGLYINMWQRNIHSGAVSEHRNQTHFWQDWHLMSDIAASVAVVAGGLIMLVAEKWYWIDGVLSVGIGLLIVTFVSAKLLGFEIHSHEHHGSGCKHKH